MTLLRFAQFTALTTTALATLAPPNSTLAILTTLATPAFGVI